MTPFFILDPGIVHVAESRLISSHVASLASQLRTPVKARKNQAVRLCPPGVSVSDLGQGAAELVLCQRWVMAAVWLFPKFLDYSRRCRIAGAVLPVDSPYHDGGEVAAYLAGHFGLLLPNGGEDVDHVFLLHFRDRFWN